MLRSPRHTHKLIKWVDPNTKKESFLIPLTGAFAEVEILDFVAKVTESNNDMKTKKINQSKQCTTISSLVINSKRYEFPLEPKAAVCEFWAEIGDKKIIGQIKEKEGIFSSLSII